MTLTPNARATYTITRDGELAAIISPRHRGSGLPRFLLQVPQAGLILKHLNEGLLGGCQVLLGVALKAPSGIRLLISMSLDAELDADLHTALVEMGVIQTNGAGQPPSISGSAVDAAGRFAGPPPPRLSPADEAEARRIAAELDRLHRDGAIASKSAHDLDAVFYAKLLRDFGAI